MKTDQFGASIATLKNDIDYCTDMRESDPELSDARIKEFQLAIEILENVLLQDNPER